jgi:2-hydroxycyclohexanecarboxyl-CoA dehydrogenase
VSAGGRRVALVTGGAKGIGAAIAGRLSEDGLAVAILDIDDAEAARIAATLPAASAHTADVASYEQVASAVGDVVARWGGIDVVVNNAGWDRLAPFLDTGPDLWDRLIGVDLLGPIHVSHTAIPHLVRRGGGRVVNIASEAGRVGGTGHAVYAACKGGLIALTKALARELGPAGVTVNCVCPGLTDTDLMRSSGMTDESIAAVVAATPLGRLAETGDTAGVVSFLASGDAAFVTGQVLSVSGGLTTVG